MTGGVSTGSEAQLSWTPQLPSEHWEKDRGQFDHWGIQYRKSFTVLLTRTIQRQEEVAGREKREGEQQKEKTASPDGIV